MLINVLFYEYGTNRVRGQLFLIFHTYSYDCLGRRTLPEGMSESFVYDANGNTTYRYGSQNRLTQVQTKNSNGTVISSLATP
ncbi:hypothetical protein MNBD_GAMMA19-2144 [hydrothermal vent metagenome]|uniref:Rhs-family protein n=1 Tax=hydrothermal vent metagenome TaxID=652676 RepID=A0A3B1BGP3_9ZZZZ